MMSKILLLGLILSSASVFAQDASEEAIILNQELQFLEEAANNVTIHGFSADNTIRQERARPIDTRSLEEQYFGSESGDAVQLRTAAPKRRRVE